MGRFAESDISPSDGFIREIFMNVCNNCDAEQIKSFADLRDDEERYRFMATLECRQAFKVTRNETSLKNYALALTFKQKGNEKFQMKQWIAAVDFYNKSLLIIPSEYGKYNFDTFEFSDLIQYLLQNKISQSYWQIDPPLCIIWRNTIRRCKTLNWLNVNIRSK